MARNRRSKEEVLQAKIIKIDNELAKYNEKINSLTEEKSKIEDELKIVLDAKAKAEQQKKMAAIVKVMDSKGLTVEDLEQLIANYSDIDTNMPKPEVVPTEESAEEN